MRACSIILFATALLASGHALAFEQSYESFLKEFGNSTRPSGEELIGVWGLTCYCPPKIVYEMPDLEGAQGAWGIGLKDEEGAIHLGSHTRVKFRPYGDKLLTVPKFSLEHYQNSSNWSSAEADSVRRYKPAYPNDREWVTVLGEGNDIRFRKTSEGKIISVVYYKPSRLRDDREVNRICLWSTPIEVGP